MHESILCPYDWQECLLHSEVSMYNNFSYADDFLSRAHMIALDIDIVISRLNLIKNLS